MFIVVLLSALRSHGRAIHILFKLHVFKSVFVAFSKISSELAEFKHCDKYMDSELLYGTV